MAFIKTKKVRLIITIEKESFSIPALITFNPSNGMSNQTAHVVFGKVDDSAPADFDTDEVETFQWMSQEEAKKLVAGGEIADGVALVALLLFFNNYSK